MSLRSRHDEEQRRLVEELRAGCAQPPRTSRRGPVARVLSPEESAEVDAELDRLGREIRRIEREEPAHRWTYSSDPPPMDISALYPDEGERRVVFDMRCPLVIEEVDRSRQLLEELGRDGDGYPPEGCRLYLTKNPPTCAPCVRSATCAVRIERDGGTT